MYQLQNLAQRRIPYLKHVTVYTKLIISQMLLLKVDKMVLFITTLKSFTNSSTSKFVTLKTRPLFPPLECTGILN